MKLQNFILVTAAAVAMSSCSNEELDSNLLADSNAISFNAVANKASRATIVNATSDIKDFTVDAFTNSGAQYMTETKIKKDSSNWVYANDADLRYWPNTGNLDFYAVSPANATKSITNDKKTISYTATDEYSSDDIADNTDVMYAVALDKTKTTNNGVVNLQFHHILSQVMFKAKTENVKDFVVNIKNFSICNVKSDGTYKVPASASNDDNKLENWNTESSSKTSYVVLKGNEDTPVTTINSNTTTTDINPTTPLLMIPQELTKWVPAKITGETTTSYLKIDCQILQNGQYLHGENGKYPSIYVPFGTTWEPGKRYTYTLTFGGGYDANGNPILTPITFTAQVDDWTNVDGGEIKL